MAILKKVSKPQELEIGERYLDCENRCVLVYDGAYPVSGVYKFHDVDDRNDIYLRFSDIQGNLRIFNITEMELRALLCTSMIEFLELMLFEKNKKGGNL